MMTTHSLSFFHHPSKNICIKTVDPCFHFLKAGPHSPTHPGHNYILCHKSASISKLTLTNLFNMVQLKLFVVFILAAAATHVVALPVPGPPSVFYIL